MEFRILGALDVRDGDRRIPLGAGKQRATLAILLLHANHVVPTERLIDELWAENPPDTARKAVQVYVTRLRKALGPDRIRTHDPGYVLEVEPGELDLHRFQTLVEKARKLRREGEPAGAVSILRDALALWNGPPLADFTYEPFAQAEISLLEGQRLEAVEERIDAELSLGHGAELVGELEALVAQYPYRERPRGQLMLALYRDGRQADALAAYQETRKLLVDELGIEPSPALQRLEGSILRHEPALETVLEEPEASVAPEPARKSGRRRWWLAAAGALVLVAGAVLVGLTRTSGQDFLPDLDENTVGVIDPDAARIEAQVSLPGRPSAVTAGGGFVWVASETNGTVSRIDPDLRDVQTLAVRGGAAGLAYGGGSLWVTNPAERTVSQIEPDRLRVVQTFGVGNGPSAVAFGAGAVWVANTFDGSVAKIPLDGEAPRAFPVGTTPSGITVGAEAVWVTSESSGTVVRLDPESGRALAPVNVGNGPEGIAVGEGGVWVANRQDGTVSRIDADRNAVSATIPVGESPTALAIGLGAVWTANAGDGTITRIDPETTQVDGMIPVVSSPSALALADGRVWASTLSAPGAHRGGVLRVEAEISCACIDPAVPGTGWLEPGAFTLAYDGLVAYRRVEGVAGSALVPNLAVRIPEPSAAGRAYAFELRPDLLYSDGTPVRASDFRASLERALTLNADSAHLYREILGAQACSARPGRLCDLSEGIEVDDAARTIVIRLAEPDPALLHALALPAASVLPADTPRRVARSDPIPGTGPYRILERASADEIRFVRNERFRVWSPEARPDGYPDEIRIRVSDPEAFAERLAAVEEERADLMSVNDHLAELGPDGLTRLLTKHAGRLHLDPAPVTFYMFLNTRVPPFDDVRVRRALNYALDRREFVELVAHPAFVDAPCQILPPGFPGFRPYCPYTLDPNEGGVWTAPDRARAKALVAASGTRGMRVQLVTFDSPGTRLIARYFRSLLDRLGYRAAVRVLPQFAPDYLEHVANSRTRTQIGQQGWGAEFLAASTFFEATFSCAAFVPESPQNSNFSQICDSALDTMMSRAASAQAADPTAAGALWAEIDRNLVDRAATVPFARPRFAILVSKRVGNYQSHPLWGPLFDQLWVE